VENPPPLDRTISPFLRLLVAIARAEVDFAVVGGVAVCLNDHVRYTADADILVNPGQDNIKRLLAVLSQWGEGWARELKPEEFIAQEAPFVSPRNSTSTSSPRCAGGVWMTSGPGCGTSTRRACGFHFSLPRI
jgi:hypothetical protein